ncbi:hypothetical protein EJ04DRAFT_515414 [Polyplosphaeria fusca]|uniref:Uncharacterized protein n=1 Tax=Polyplosphaeria fusca TaxID=682080 RepID=A0A9P4QSM4_9PLEO|nr:hypothetical protein EJ04DRAFT_515414 [Polyplosphaeria fusca]
MHGTRHRFVVEGARKAFSVGFFCASFAIPNSAWYLLIALRCCYIRRRRRSSADS